MKPRKVPMRRTPMPRGTTPLKRTELKRSSPIQSRGSVGDASPDGPPTQPNGPTKRRKTGQSAEEKHGRNVVYLRSGGWCEIQLAEICAGRACQWHHRLNRSQGGTWAASNGLHVCVPCHVYVTDGERAEAKAKGWAVAPGVIPPAEVPVLRRGQWVLLDDEGGMAAVEGECCMSQQDMDLLLWLHAEAVWQRDIAVGALDTMAHTVRSADAEARRWKQLCTKTGVAELEASRRDWAAEAGRLQQAMEDLQQRFADQHAQCELAVAAGCWLTATRWTRDAIGGEVATLAEFDGTYKGHGGQCTSINGSPEYRCEWMVGHDGEHRRYVGPYQWELWSDKLLCSCLTAEQAAVVTAGGFSLPLCAVHPEVDRG